MSEASDLNTYLKRRGSPLAGLGSVFVREARKNGLDPKLLVAISGAESSFGQKVKAGTNNPFGYGPHRPFPSWQAAISTVARSLRENYLDEGRKTIAQIGAKWAPEGAANDPTGLNSNWSRNVGRIYSQLGGAGFGGASTSEPSPASLSGESSPLPDLAPAILGSLGNFSPKRFDANELLSSLVAAKGAYADSQSSPIPGVAPTPRMPSQGAYGGSTEGWGGSKAVAVGLIDGLGLPVASEKRDRRNTTSGRPSDHWIGSKTSYAFDLGGSVAQMDAAAVALAGKLGIKYRQGQPLKATLVRNGYRIQVLYRTSVGGDHFDHLHVGVRKLG